MVSYTDKKKKGLQTIHRAFGRRRWPNRDIVFRFFHGNQRDVHRDLVYDLVFELLVSVWSQPVMKDWQNSSSSSARWGRISGFSRYPGQAFRWGRISGFSRYPDQGFHFAYFYFHLLMFISPWLTSEELPDASISSAITKLFSPNLLTVFDPSRLRLRRQTRTGKWRFGPDRAWRID